MRYSIIIPTLNEEKLLPNLLKQLSKPELKKKYDFELIISDGGSSDKTVSIAEKFAEKVISNEGNRKENISIGRNKGAAAASGDVLIFLNADTELESADYFLSVIEEKFYESEYLALTCRIDIKKEDKKLSDSFFLAFYNLYFHLLNIIGVGMGRGECQVVRKKVFQDVGGFNENLPAGEDFELYNRIRRKGNILFERKLTVYESPRRYRKFGHFSIFLTWTLNGIFVLFRKKSMSKEWEQIR